MGTTVTDIILMTGATGFLGTELAARLVRISQSKIYALVRAAGEAEAHHRLRAAWSHDKELYQAVGTQILPVPGDFTKPDLGLYVADAVLQISFSEKAVGKTFHLTCPKEAAPWSGELAEYVRAWAKQNLSLALPKPVFLPSPVLKRAGGQPPR